MPKKTFHSKLYEMVKDGLIDRDPDSNGPSPHTGKKVTFKLSTKGEKKIVTQETLFQFERHYQDILEQIAIDSYEVGKAQPLTGCDLFITSTSLPICTISHLPSKEQYQKLKTLMNSKEKQISLGKLINRVIEFYVSEKENEVYADIISQKESIFTMGFLSKDVSLSMNQAKDAGVFSAYWQIMLRLTQVTEEMWRRFSKNLQDSEFLAGKKGTRFNFVFRYVPSEKNIQVSVE